jgi:hypothetical protein
MIVAIVSFKLTQPKTLEEMKPVFQGTAPKYLNLPGLLRKNYFLTEDGMRAGGIYVWESKERAQQFYSPEWQNFVAGKYGAPPEILYVASPVMVDNRAGQITVD